jgi:trimethylamine---corrinoid protein Co-methyltransferase
MTLSLEVLSREEAERMHAASVEVLERTGMRFDSPVLLEGLERRGATVDRASRVAKIPARIVEDAVDTNRRLLRKGKKLHLLNGVTSSLSDNRRIEAKVSGGCESFLDWETRTVRPATAAALLASIRLGEMIPEVDFVGNPIVLKQDLQGRPVDERIRRIETAALVAKNTRKVGSMEVWDPREIDLLVEIGTIARGGPAEYAARPCLVTAKETISPLHLDERSGDILVELAKRDLPCTIIPMPISGLSAPATRLGNAVVGNAEILAVIAAIQSVCPEAVVGGGTISGIVDMRTGIVSFSAPEAIIQDIAIAEVHQKIYGMDYLIGTGYTDAHLPNPQVLAEKTMKLLLTFLSGRYTYPVGLVNSGAIYSDEQALVDLELCRFIHAHFSDLGDSAGLGGIVDLIDKVGIRGAYLPEDHTLEHFRDNWLPELFDRTHFAGVGAGDVRDVYDTAHRRVRELLSAREFWQIDPDRAREIDRVVEKAKRVLLS